MTYAPVPAEDGSRKTVVKAVSGALGCGVILVLSNLAVSFGFTYLYRRYFEGASQTLLEVLDILSYLALLFPAALFLMFFFRKERRPRSADLPLVPKLPFLFIPMAIGAGYLTSILTDNWFGRFFNSFSHQTTLEDFPTDPAAVLLYFIAIVILPAFLEEFVYRGLLLKNLLPIGKTAAVVLSAGIFALSHPSLSQSAFAFAVGIPLGVAFAETGSIWFCVIIHALTNLISFGVCYWGFVWPQEWLNDAVYNLMVILLIHAFLAGVVVYSMLRIFSRRRALQEGRPEAFNTGSGSVKYIFANPLLYLWIAAYIAMLFLYYRTRGL